MWLFFCYAFLSDSCPSGFIFRLPSLLHCLSLWTDIAVIYSNSSSGATCSIEIRGLPSRKAQFGEDRFFSSLYLTTGKLLWTANFPVQATTWDLSDCLRSRHLPSTPLRLGEMNTKASLCSRKTNLHVPSDRGLTFEAEMENQCGTAEFAGRDLSGLKNYFKLRSLSLASITGPEPARGRKMF